MSARSYPLTDHSTLNKVKDFMGLDSGWEADRNKHSVIKDKRKRVV